MCVSERGLLPYLDYAVDDNVTHTEVGTLNIVIDITEINKREFAQGKQNFWKK